MMNIFVSALCVFVLSVSVHASDHDDLTQHMPRVMVDTKRAITASPEDIQSKRARPTTFGRLDALPRDLIGRHIVKYCDDKVLQVNTSFFTLVTGYPSSGIFDQGFDSKPTQHIYSTGTYKKLRSFRKDLNQIPSFVWCSMIQAVFNLDPDYWPYLKQSRVQEFALDGFDLTLPHQNLNRIEEILEEIQICRIELFSCLIQHSNEKKFIEAIIKSNINILDLTFSGLINHQGWIQLICQSQIGCLYLNFEHIGDDNVCKIAQILPNKKIKTLNLYDNHITDIGAAALTETFKLDNFKHHSLQSLWLGANHISAPCLLNLCQSIQHTNIHILSLSKLYIGKNYMQRLGQCLQKSHVQKLMLDLNMITENGIRDLIQALQKSCVSLLSLSGNMIKDDDLVGLDQYLKHTQIHTLILSKNEITNIGFHHLIKALAGSAVRKLYLGENKITSEGIGNLIRSFEGTLVYKLDLLGTKIDVLGLCQLIDSLKNMPIKKLGLGKTFNSKLNVIHERKWQDFARAVQESSLTKLDLSHNGFKMTDACHIVQACQNSSVHHLDLSDNDIEDETIPDLIQVLQNSPLKKINLSHNNQLREFSKVKLIRDYPEIRFYFNKYEGTKTMTEKPFKINVFK